MSDQEKMVYTIEGDAKQLIRVLNNVEKHFDNLGKAADKVKMPLSGKTSTGIKSLTSSLSGLGGSFGIVAGAAAGVAGAITAATLAMQKMVKETSQIETASMKWEVLYGSAEKAGDKMKEIQSFAAKTPFDFKGVEKAAQNLNVLTDGALDTEEALRMTGDMAAMANTPIEELSVWIGRLYSNMEAGRPFGEASARLQELGIISSSTRNKLEDLQKSGASANEMWRTFQEETSKANGMMDKMSGTLGGKLSNLGDTWDMAFTMDADGTNNAIFKSLIDDLITATEGLKPVMELLGGSLGLLLKPLTLAASGWGLMFSSLEEAISGNTEAVNWNTIGYNDAMKSLAQQAKAMSDEEIKLRVKKTDDLIKDTEKKIKKFDEEKAVQDANGTGVFFGTKDRGKLQNELADLKSKQDLYDREAKLRGLFNKPKTNVKTKNVSNKIIDTTNNLLYSRDELAKFNGYETSKWVTPFALDGIGDVYTGLTNAEKDEKVEKARNEARERIEEQERRAKAEAIKQQEFWNKTLTITDSFANTSLGIFQTWADDSNDVFQSIVGTLTSGVSGASGIAGAFGASAGVMGALGIAGAGLGLVGGIYDIFANKADKERAEREEREQNLINSSKINSESINSSRTNIVSSGPETLNVYNNVDVNTSYIGSDIDLRDFVTNSICPILTDSVQGVV